jgi:Uncharacterized conserved protein (some members contain a von Willebrand factor type A (vWA) domain)
MKKLIYIATLVAVWLFYIFQVSYFSYIMVVIVPAVLVISLVFTAVLMCFCRINTLFRVQKNTEGKEQVFLDVTLEKERIYPEIKLKMSVENLFHGKKKRIKIMLDSHLGKGQTRKIFDGECGVYRCKVRSAWLSEFLGVCRIPMICPKDVEILSLPERIPFVAEGIEKMFAVWKSGKQQTKQENAENREFIGVRDYKERDTLKDVHWKLTARRGEMVVREYETQNEREAEIAFCWGNSYTEAERALGRLLGLMFYLKKEGISFVLNMFNEEGAERISFSKKNFHAVKNESEEFFNAVLKKKMSRPLLESEKENAMLRGFGKKTAAYFFVDAQAVHFYENGAIKERFE